MLSKNHFKILCVVLLVAACATAIGCDSVRARGGASQGESDVTVEEQSEQPNFPSQNQSERIAVAPQRGYFDVQVLVGGAPLQEYAARGRRYVEAVPRAEYSIQIRNPLPVRVAVALSVDGLNTIDARHTSAWEASKWILQPYETITISGWQMNQSRARRFYFTTERDSYGAKIGRAADLGNITAVFYREQGSGVRVAPRPYEDDVTRSESGRRADKDRAQSNSAPQADTQSSAQSGAEARKAAPSVAGSVAVPAPNDEYAATGIGRNVRNDVEWVNLALESQPAAQVNLRYEYRDALIRLGVLPRPYPNDDTLNRRERARGFNNGTYCPEVQR